MGIVFHLGLLSTPVALATAVGLCLVLMFVSSIIMRIWIAQSSLSSRLINDWASMNGIELLSFTPAAFERGPFRYTSRLQYVYQIHGVKDEEQLRLWVCIGTRRGAYPEMLKHVETIPVEDLNDA